MSSADAKPASLAAEVLEAFQDLNGPHAGFRPVHAKGILLTGTFRPSSAARSLTRAPHIQRESTPAAVRFSDFAGVPAIPDNDPQASPRGIAIRFYLAEHVHTDIIGHTVDGFPTRTVEEFLEFLRAIRASTPEVPSPTPVERFFSTHPAALQFAQTPKPIPTSFANESFYAVNAYQFTNGSGDSRYGRYRIRPDMPAKPMDPEAAAKASPDFLFDEIRQRLARGPVKMNIAVQAAAPGDVVNDATVQWPADRPEIDFGTVELNGVMPDNDDEQRHIIFDPIPRVDGILPSDDPLLEPRASIYLMSGRRRRSSGKGQALELKAGDFAAVAVPGIGQVVILGPLEAGSSARWGSPRR